MGLGAARAVLAVLGLLAVAGAVPVSLSEDEVLNSTTTEANQSSASYDLFLGTTVILEMYGYGSETFHVTTSDGYVLTVHRIPNPGKPVVFLMHGILSSSADWVVSGPEKSLGLLLYNSGFDVWMGNARGNKFSLNHTSLSTDSSDFWDFSWHEIGMYDLPAMIDVALNETGRTNLTYIGHSQGTTTFFVMASMLPEYNQKISAMHALAPIAYMNDVKSEMVQLAAKGTTELAAAAKTLGINEVLQSTRLLVDLLGKVCGADAKMCLESMFLITGSDMAEFNTTLLTLVTENFPAGSSTRQMIHYGQLISAGKAVFRQYNYGLVENLLKYRSISPPEYPIAKITALVNLHYGENDYLAVPECSQLLEDKLPNVSTRKVPLASFNHVDFLYAEDAPELLYNAIIESIET